MESLKVGVVGCGVGRSHVVDFKRLPGKFEVAAICDIDAGKARALAAEHGIPAVATDLAELCRMEHLDVIDICTPPFLHYEQALQVLAAGKHVILEKPTARSLQEADALIAAEARSGRRVMPIFQYRFGVGLQKLKLLVDEGVTGRAYLTTVEMAWRRRADYYATGRGAWRTNLGGPLATLAIHLLDAAYCILGPAARVFARTATLVNPIETEDCVAATLEMADGSLLSLAVTVGSSQQISRHRFCFSNLSAESNTVPYANTVDPWTFTADSPEVEQRIQATLARFEPLPEGFAGQFYRFHHAFEHGAELPVTLADARASLELVTAIYHSAQTAQQVTLPIGRDHPMYAGWWPGGSMS